MKNGTSGSTFVARRSFGRKVIDFFKGNKNVRKASKKPVRDKNLHMTLEGYRRHNRMRAAYLRKLNGAPRYNTNAFPSNLKIAGRYYRKHPNLFVHTQPSV